jgi:hypothetical protein
MPTRPPWPNFAPVVRLDKPLIKNDDLGACGRARHNRPRRRRAAEQRDERAAIHSITSSVRARSCGGTVMPSILAASALMTNSNFDACITGRSMGLAPLRMRPA